MKSIFYGGELFGLFFSSVVGDLMRIKNLMLVGWIGNDFSWNIDAIIESCALAWSCWKFFFLWLA